MDSLWKATTLVLRRQSTNSRTRLVGALLIIHSVGFGCGGFVTLTYAIVIVLVAVTTGLQYMVLAVAAGAVAAAVIGLAAALWVLARKLRSRLNRWTVIVLAIEVILTPIRLCAICARESGTPCR